MLKCASMTASYTNYEKFLHEDGSETQEKTWTFTAEDLKRFLVAIDIEKK